MGALSHTRQMQQERAALTDTELQSLQTRHIN